MGEMAEEAYIEALIEQMEMEDPIPGWLKIEAKKAGNKKMYSNQTSTRYTEDILNSDKWVTSHGEILEVRAMDPDHVRNVLSYLYKRKDRYWLNCRDGKLIEQFENGEDFFQRVIRKSTLWTTAIETLTQTNYAGFNFEWEGK